MGRRVSATMLERDRELRALSAALESARRGHGGLVVLEGAAGSGKSMLLDRTVSHCRDRGLPVLRARGAELEWDLPFGVARQLVAPALEVERRRAGAPPAASSLERLLREPPFEGGDEGFAVTHRLFRLIAELSGAGSEPLVVAVDDVQWADRSSLRFLAHLALRLGTLPVLVLLAVRTGDPLAHGDLLDTLRDGSTSVRLPLAPLSRDAIAQLAGAIFRREVDDAFVAACARATAGSPLLVHELLASLRDDGIEPTADGARSVEALVPETLLRIAIVRLGRLGDDAGAIARAVAVLGDGALLRHAARLAGVPSERAELAADRLAAAEIIRDGEPLGFAHPLIGAAVLEEIPAFALAQAHRAAASLLAEDGFPDSRVAAHASQTKPSGEGWLCAVLLRVGLAALEGGDPAAAMRLLRRAHAEPPGDALRGEVLVALARAETAAGDERALDRIDEALVALPAGSRRDEARAVLARGLFARGDYDEAVQVAEHGLAGLEPEDPSAEALIGVYLLASSAVDPSRGPSIMHTERLVERAAHGWVPADPSLAAQLAVRLAARNGDPGPVLAIARDLLDADPLVERATHGMVLSALLAALVFVDELTVAREASENAVSAARRAGSVVAEAVALHWRAAVRIHLGELAGAAEDAAQSLELLDRSWGASNAWASSALATAQLHLGDLEGAHRALAAGLALRPARPYSSVLLAAGQLALAEDRVHEALAALQATGRAPEIAYQNHPGMIAWQGTCAVALARLGRHVEARALAGAELVEARRLGLRRPLAAALRASASLASPAEAVVQLHEALATLGDSPARIERTEVLVALGAALLEAGDPGAAREPLRAALELAVACGAAPLVERARELLRQAGARPRRVARHGPAALTGAERRIAELALDGLTNREIAETLFVTLKTVEWHLRHVYAKLGASGRRELREALAEGIEDVG